MRVMLKYVCKKWDGVFLKFFLDYDLFSLIFIFLLFEQQELVKLRELSRSQEEHAHSFGRRERHDSSESIEDSLEAKRLRSEISKLQAECQHWKSIAHGTVSILICRAHCSVSVYHQTLLYRHPLTRTVYLVLAFTFSPNSTHLIRTPS